MNRIKVVLLAGLFLGTAAFTYAQDPKPDEPKPEDRRAPEDEAKPPKPEKQEVPKEPKERDLKNEKQDRAQEQAKPEEHGQMDHARPAGKSGHIPDDRFKTNFGRQHHFSVQQVITTRTVIVNQTNFVYGGYTFVFLDPWPSAWMFTDDCYVDYIDGEYFLIDVMHPGIRVALFVQL